MPRNNTDPRVDAYIDALPEWQQAICHQVRELVHSADLGVEETIKRTGRDTSGDTRRSERRVGQQDFQSLRRSTSSWPSSADVLRSIKYWDTTP